MSVFGTSKMKLFVGSQKVKKAYIGTQKIYSAGNIVTYYIDSNTYYQEEVDSDTSCLSPSTFTPSKSGWTFLGWREDTSASSSVLSSKIMGDAPITLYAVFKQDVTLTYYDDSTTAQYNYGTRYYNNGNINNPSLTMTQSSKSGWTAKGWATATQADASIIYNNGATITLDSDKKIYGRYDKSVKWTFKSYNSTQESSGTMRYNSAGSTKNAEITIPTGATYSGWSWRGWSDWQNNTAADASPRYSNGQTISSSGGTTVYGLYEQTIYLYYNGNGSTSGSVSTQSGTRYWNAYGNTSNPSFTLASNGYSRTNGTFLAWASGSASGTQYSPGASVTLSSSTTFYAKWSVTSAVTFDLWRGSAQGDETLTRTITSSYVSNVSVVGRLRSNSTDGDNNGDGRCDVTLYINDTQIGFVGTHDDDTTVDINQTNLGAFSSVTIKMLVHPHSWNWGEGLFSGTVTTTTIV